MKKRGMRWSCPCCRGKIYAGELKREMNCPHCMSKLYVVKNIKRATLNVFLIILAEVFLLEPLLSRLMPDVPYLLSALVRSSITLLLMLFSGYHCVHLYTERQRAEKARDASWDASGW